MTAILAQTVQFLVAALGGFAFHLLGIPAAWMSGAMVAVVILGAFGRSRPLPRPLADAAMLVSGATMGGGITPEALAAVTRYPASLALLVLAVAAGTGASMLWLTRAAGWRRDDALLASAPGALSTVLVIAVERKASVGSIVVVQSIRLFVLIALLPSLVVFLGGGAPGSRLPGEGMPLESPAGLAAILVGGLALGLVLERLRFAAPILLGATLVSATLHATGFAPGVVPPPVAVVGLVLIGVFIGERFRTLELTSLRRVLPAALGSLVLSTGVAMSLAAAASGLAGVGLSEALVAFAPGGLEAMMVLALILGLDPLYVGVHHLARFLGIAMVLPVAVGFLGRPQGETAEPADSVAAARQPPPPFLTSCRRIASTTSWTSSASRKVARSCGLPRVIAATLSSWRPRTSGRALSAASAPSGASQLPSAASRSGTAQSRMRIEPAEPSRTHRLWSSCSVPPTPPERRTGTAPAVSTASMPRSLLLPSGYSTTARRSSSGPMRRRDRNRKCDTTSRVKPPWARRSSHEAASACHERGQRAKATSIRIARGSPTAPSAIQVPI